MSANKTFWEYFLSALLGIHQWHDFASGITSGHPYNVSGVKETERFYRIQVKVMSLCEL